MSGDKFTPGPWIKDGLHYYGSNGEKVIVSDGPAFGSASVFPYAIHNAHLVAAAPCNYSAHEYLLDGVIKVLAGIPVRDMDERIMASEKALAKSRGES